MYQVMGFEPLTVLLRSTCAWYVGQTVYHDPMNIWPVPLLLKFPYLHCDTYLTWVDCWHLLYLCFTFTAVLILMSKAKLHLVVPWPEGNIIRYTYTFRPKFHKYLSDGKNLVLLTKSTISISSCDSYIIGVCLSRGLAICSKKIDNFFLTSPQ